MRRSYLVAVSAAALLVLVAAVVVHGGVAVVAPGQPLEVPTATLPAAEGCCLWQLHKKGVGERRAQFGSPYRCDTGQTVQGPTQIRLTLSTEGQPCDQNPALVPDRSTLQASGRTIRRADGFAHFEGNFRITNPAGTVLFSGRMEAIDRIGTHHAPYGTEACNQQGHLEGWLTGKGAGPLESFALHALIVARASLGATGASASVASSIDGVLVKCP